MRKSIVMSGLLHATLVAVSVVSLQLPFNREAPQPKSIMIELATPADLTRKIAGSQKVTPKKSVATLKPVSKKKVVKAAPAKRKVAPKRVTAAKKPQTAADKRVAKQQAEELLGLKTASLPRRKPRLNKKIAAKSTQKSKFDADRIAALLNKVPQQSAATADKAAAITKGFEDGQDTKMTISEINALRARISQCWSPPVAGLGAASTSVKLRIKLRRDGTLAEAPSVVRATVSPIFRAAADSAIRAIWQCQPYMLPAAKYAVWQDMILNFDPKEMIGR